jgi:RNA polymerase sigma factor (sigma-70 family)
VDFFRTRKETLSLEQPVARDEDIRLADLIRDTSRSAASELERQEMINTLYRLLDTLSENERALILATEMEGYTFRELAEQWQVPINTLLSRKSRAMHKLINGVNRQSEK